MRSIVTISRLPLLEKLSLRLPSFFPTVSFAPLACAPQLQELCCSAVDQEQLTHDHLDQLRMLSHLRTMSGRNLKGDSLLYLLRAPHSLQWQEIRAVDDLDDEVGTALSTFPTLTALHASSCRSVAFLPTLIRLRSLWLSMLSAVRLAAEVVAGLSCCSQLTALMLVAKDVTSQQMSQLLPCLPALRSLELWYCSSVASLSFFSECSHLSHSLQSLHLWGGAAAHCSEITHVLTLKSLTHLVIRQFFVEPLDAPMEAALRPPSLVLPDLKNFDYKR